MNSFFVGRWKYGQAYIWRLVVAFAAKSFRKKAFFDRVVSHFQEKVGSTGVLNGEHTVHVGVAGLDKATISMHCYFAASRSLVMFQGRCF